MNWKGALCVLMLVLLLCESNFIAANLFNKNSNSTLNRNAATSSTSNVQAPQIKEHKLTYTELVQLQSEEGVYVADESPNQTTNSFEVDAHPPTAEEWSVIASNAFLVDSITPLDALATSVDNSQTPWFPPIAVQNHGCTAFSVGYYIKTFQESKEHGWDLSGAKWEGFATNSGSTSNYGHPTEGYQDKIMSPAFVYNLNDPSGSIESAMSLVCNIGDSTWAKMPYDGNSWTNWPSEEAWQEACLYRGNNSLGYQYLNLKTDVGIANLKSFLASQNLASIYIDSSALNTTNLGSQDLLTTDNYNSLTHDHVNTIVGFDDSITYLENGTTHYGAFKIANSWGAGIYHWENNPDGFYWISYETMKQQFKTCLFFNDLIGYKPDLTISFKIVDEKRSDFGIYFGVGYPAPIDMKFFSNYVSGYPYPYTKNDYLPFPDNKIVVDITEFEKDLPSVYNQTYWLALENAGNTTGTIASFSITSPDGYQNCVDVPYQISNNTYVYLTNNYTTPTPLPTPTPAPIPTPTTPPTPSPTQSSISIVTSTAPKPTVKPTTVPSPTPTTKPTPEPTLLPTATITSTSNPIQAQLSILIYLIASGVIIAVVIVALIVLKRSQK